MRLCYHRFISYNSLDIFLDTDIQIPLGPALEYASRRNVIGSVFVEIEGLQVVSELQISAMTLYNSKAFTDINHIVTPYK